MIFVPCGTYLMFNHLSRLMDEIAPCLGERNMSNVGTVTIIFTLVQKPIIVMPHRASLGAHRNEHQIFAADKFEELINDSLCRQSY